MSIGYADGTGKIMDAANTGTPEELIAVGERRSGSNGSLLQIV